MGMDRGLQEPTFRMPISTEPLWLKQQPTDGELSVCVSLSLFITLSAFMCLSVPVCVYPHICLSICLSFPTTI